MHDLEIIEQHQVIRETIGYEKLNEVELVDIPELLRFLKVMHDYIKMQQILEENEI